MHAHSPSSKGTNRYMGRTTSHPLYPEAHLSYTLFVGFSICCCRQELQGMFRAQSSVWPVVGAKHITVK